MKKALGFFLLFWGLVFIAAYSGEKSNGVEEPTRHYNKYVTRDLVVHILRNGTNGIRGDTVRYVFTPEECVDLDIPPDCSDLLYIVKIHTSTAEVEYVELNNIFTALNL